MNKNTYVISMAEIFGVNMTKTRLNAYIDALENVTLKEVEKAYKLILNDHHRRFMPLPGEILEYINPTLNEKDEAILIINNIKLAVKKFGWHDATGAKSFLKNDWDNVIKLGGWKYICEDPTCNLNNPTIYAQKRDLVKSYKTYELKNIKQLCIEKASLKALESHDV